MASSIKIKYLYSQVKEEQGTLNIRCNICEMTVFGIRLVYCVFTLIYINLIISEAGEIQGRFLEIWAVFNLYVIIIYTI